MKNIFALLMFVAFITGCTATGENPAMPRPEKMAVIAPAAVPTIGAMALSTLSMIKEWASADSAKQQCVAGYKNDPANGEKICEYYRQLTVNKSGVRQCGAKVYKIVPKDPQAPFRDYTSVVLEDDTDADGITNWHEYKMGLNMCSKSTYGTKDDADLDYDADGVTNGKDSAPLCNNNDPAHYQIDCV